MNWSFKIFTIFRIPVLVHWTLPLFMAGQFIGDLANTPEGYHGIVLKYSLASMALLFIQVLTHELGHCWGARRVGEHAEQILLWPLGGLAYVGHTEDPRRDWIITIAGPAVTVLWALISAGGLLAMGFQLTLDSFNPLGSWWPAGARDFLPWLLATNLRMSVVLAAFNLLVPAYPLDGCRLLLGFLTVRIGPGPAMRTTAMIAIPTGVVIAMLGFWKNSVLVILLGIWVTIQSIALYRQAHQAGEFGESSYSGRGYVIRDEKRKEGFFQRRRREKRERALARRDAEEAELRAKVDELLDKVNRNGIASLTPAERKTLEDASSRLRRNG
jgi:stage IV sporulation protein FB